MHFVWSGWTVPLNAIVSYQTIFKHWSLKFSTCSSLKSSSALFTCNSPVWLMTVCSIKSGSVTRWSSLKVDLWPGSPVLRQICGPVVLSTVLFVVYFICYVTSGLVLVLSWRIFSLRLGLLGSSGLNCCICL